jgi:hypothetical protein
MARQVSRVIVPAFLACGVLSFAQSGSAPGKVPPNELLRQVVENEIKVQNEDHSHWMYHLRSGLPGREEEKEVIETKDGNLEHLIAVNGTLTPEQEQRENKRIQELVNRPTDTRKAQKDREQDAQRAERMLKMLPDAVIATYGDRHGDLVDLNFKPNPEFYPSSREAQVFHAMEGKIWVDAKENRLAEIDGHLFKEVKFGGGILGHLNQGGRVQVKMAKVAPHHWEITSMRVNMSGKALFFKTIGVQQNETRDKFQSVPADLTLAQAAERLLTQARVTGHLR